MFRPAPLDQETSMYMYSRIPGSPLSTTGKDPSLSLLLPFWNNLPLYIRTEPSTYLFISKLKTHLFTN